MSTETITFEPAIYDFSFKYLFGYNKNIRFTEYLLEALFNKEKGYYHDKLEIMNSFTYEKTSLKERGLESDVKIKLPDGTIINLEAYTEFSKTEKIKSLMYLSHTYGTQLNESDNISKAKPCIQYNFVQNIKYPYKEYKLNSEEIPYEEFVYGIFRIYVIDIAKYSKLYYNCNEKLRGICKFLRAKNNTELKKVVREEREEILKDMAKELDKFYQDKWREQFLLQFTVKYREKKKFLFLNVNKYLNLD